MTLTARAPLLLAALASLAFAAPAAAQMTQLTLRPGVAPQIPGVLLICADLAVTVEASGSGGAEGSTHFVITLRNGAAHDFVSAPGLQWVEVALSGAFGAVAPERLGFERLNAGQSRRWTLERQGSGWQAAATLVVDPATRSDAILSNNECNPANNSASAGY